MMNRADHPKSPIQGRAAAFTLVELLVVIAIVSLFFVIIGNTPGLFTTNRRVTALQQLSAVLEEARAQALRGNQNIHVAFISISSEPHLQSYRQFAIFSENENQELIQTGNWHTLPEGTLFLPTSQSPSASWTHLFHSSHDPPLKFTLTGGKTIPLHSIGFGKLGSIIHPFQSNGAIGIVIAEAHYNNGQLHHPNPDSDLTLEIRRNTGKTFIHP